MVGNGADGQCAGAKLGGHTVKACRFHFHADDAVAPGNYWDRLSRADQQRVSRKRDDFAQHHNPFIRHIVRRTRDYLEETINPETGEPYMDPIEVELYGEESDGSIPLPAYLDDAYDHAEEFCELLGERMQAAGFMETMLLRRVGSTIYAGQKTAERILRDWTRLENPDTVDEDAPTRPINPYGSSKLAAEWIIRETAQACPVRHVTLRYFNVAGCDPEARIGQSTPDAHLLIKVACQVALGLREHLAIFGTDFPTPDGTGVRDYIHVEDLADAHLRMLDHLRRGGQPLTLNVGYGHGYSVRQVVETLEAVWGESLSVEDAGRRPGDPPALVAQSERIRQLLGWRPRFDDLDTIVRTALDWERHLCGAQRYLA